jgi:hypothetical protein
MEGYSCIPCSAALNQGALSPFIFQPGRLQPGSEFFPDHLLQNPKLNEDTSFPRSGVGMHPLSLRESGYIYHQLNNVNFIWLQNVKRLRRHSHAGAWERGKR